MDDVGYKCLPGTVLPYTEQGVEAFSNIEALIAVAGGLGLSQVCAITGLEGSTIQNWVKRGWVSNPRGKKYTEEQLARIIIINALKDCVKLESIAQLMRYIGAPGPDGGVVSERELFNYLCHALQAISRADDMSGGGIASVVDELTGRYEEWTRARLRRALTVMIYACVCSDVKRRTEAMLANILPEADSEAFAGFGDQNVQETPDEDDSKDEDDGKNEPDKDSAEKELVPPPTRPWFLRRS